jgi:hypothetical protein
MIQRKQSLLMAMVIIAMGVAIWFFPLYTDGDIVFYVSDSIGFAVGAVVSFLLAFYALFQFKNRKKQFVINRLNILLNLALVVFLAFRIFNSDVETMRTGTASVFPLLSVILLSLANRLIMRDERLVKAADRVR